ncbi:hypothetical protein EGT36_08820 [Agrobacterium sp. FDAARGOS_525]|nr:hypothetical protein EGT36_08820 [Agrobacterium sp. FDAARGOS_525]
MPDLVELPAYNNRPAYFFADGNDQLYDGGANLLPATSKLSLVMVGRSGPSDNAFPVGGASADGHCTFLVHQSTGNGVHGFAVNASAPATNAGGYLSANSGRFYEGGPNIVIGSYDSEAVNKVGLRINRGVVDVAGTPVVSAPSNIATTLYAGGITVGSGAAVGQLDGGEVAEIIVLDAALHTNIVLRDKIEAMLQARYGLW